MKSLIASIGHRTLIAFFSCWFLITGLMVSFESRSPATDVFLFKEAGVNLATQGRFVAANLMHMPADEDLPYVYYPPLFPATFGLWTTLTGVGLKQSIVFDNLLRLLRTLLLLVLLWPTLKNFIRDSKTKFALAFFTLVLSFLSSDGDRPDELALVFGLASLICLKQARNILGGVFLGMCGATSPAAGIFFALVVSFFFLRTRNIRELLRWGASAAVIFIVCNLPIYISAADAFARFSKQATISNFPYSLRSLEAFLFTYGQSFSHFSRWGGAYLIATVGLILIVLFHGNKNSKNSTSIWQGSLLFLVLNLAVWTLQPYYLWFCILGLVIVILSRLQGAMTPILLLLAVSPIAVREVRGNLPAFQRNENQTAKYVAERVIARVGENAKLAVVSDQYFTFRPHRRIDNAEYVCERIADYDYVYATPRSSKRNRDRSVSFPCHASKHCFTAVEDLTQAPVFSILGLQTPFYVRGNGGVLYENQGCDLALR